jgi:hypothetical protein
MVGHARTFNEMFAPGEQEMMYRITNLEIITTILSLVVLASGVCATITINSLILPFSEVLAVIAIPIIGFITLGLMMNIAFIDEYTISDMMKRYKTWISRKVLSVPPNQRDAIYNKPIKQGRWLVDFHDEYKIGRYYTKHWYDNKCPTENPFTGEPIVHEEVTFYLAKVES